MENGCLDADWLSSESAIHIRILPSPWLLLGIGHRLLKLNGTRVQNPACLGGNGDFIPRVFERVPVVHEESVAIGAPHEGHAHDFNDHDEVGFEFLNLRAR